MEIKVVGPGCAKCEKVEKTVKEVLDEMNIDAKVEKITDINEMQKHKIMVTPGLIINGEIKASGSVPSKEKITNMITTALANEK